MQLYFFFFFEKQQTFFKYKVHVQSLPNLLSSLSLLWHAECWLLLIVVYCPLHTYDPHTATTTTATAYYHHYHYCHHLLPPLLEILTKTITLITPNNCYKIIKTTTTVIMNNKVTVIVLSVLLHLQQNSTSTATNYCTNGVQHNVLDNQIHNALQSTRSFMHLLYCNIHVYYLISIIALEYKCQFYWMWIIIVLTKHIVKSRSYCIKLDWFK